MREAPDTSGENLIGHLRRLARERKVDVDEFVVPREGDLHTGRLRLHYLDWGNEQATPAVFMHAGRLNAHSWDLICLALRGDYRCLAVDLPGHGDSQWAADGDYSAARCAEDLYGFANALGLKKFLLAGLSQGGIQSLAFAGRHSERLHGLVLLDIGPDANPAGSERHRNSMAVFEPMASFEDFVRLGLRERPLRNQEKLRFTLAQNVRQRPDGKWAWKYDTDHRLRQDPASVRADQRSLKPLVPRVACPVLVLRGERSDLLLREQAAALAAAFPDGRWAEIPGAGHFLHLDNPLALIAALRGFFAKASAEEAPSEASRAANLG